jgi:poly(A) polymerase/tRNA nucleotidyltransferase (CCA-adding enzyme)
VAAIRAAVPGLGRLSAERVWMELKRLLAAPDPRAALALMRETGVLGAVLPEAGGPERLDAAVADELGGGLGEVMLRLAMLLPPGTELAALARRLRFSGEETARLGALHAGAALPATRDAPEARALRRFAAEIAARGHATPFEAALVAKAGDPALDLAPFRNLPPGPAFPLQGRDALGLGIAPGPGRGELLAETRAWWLEGGAEADHAACLAHLGELARRDAS